MSPITKKAIPFQKSTGNKLKTYNETQNNKNVIIS